MFCIESLKKVYENGNIALENIDLEIGDIGMVALVGTSGAGKSTLLNVLSLNDDITAGSVKYNGISYDSKSKDKLAQNFGMVYQDYKLIENMTVYDNLKVAIELNGQVVDKDRVEKTLLDMDILGYMNEKVLNLSGGQKQRVAIARSLLVDASVIFADEPTGNLDSKNSAMIFEILKNISKEKLVIVVTHDTDRIKKYADRIIELSDGKVISDITLNETERVESKSERVQNICYKESKLSFSSVINLSKSLYGGKKLRRIAFSIVSVVLIMIMSVLSIMTLVSYEKIAYATFKKNDDFNSIIVKADNKRVFENNGSHETRFYKVDIGDFSTYVDGKLKGKSAKVADIITEQNLSIFMYDKNNKPISMYDYLNAGAPEKIIFMDNVSDYGVKILKGKAPSAYNEIMITDGLYEYLGVVGAYRYNDEVIYIEKDDIIGLEVGGVKIVGVFDDGFSVSEKYKKEKANNENINTEYRFSTEKVFATCVIAHTSRERYYDYLGAFAFKERGENELNATLSKDSTIKEDIKLIPYNEMTKHLVGELNIGVGEVAVGSYLMNNSNIMLGDSVNIKTYKIERVLDDNKIIENIGDSNLIVKNTIADSNYVVLNQADFDRLSANYVLPTFEMLVHKDHFSISDFEKIYDYFLTNFIEDNDTQNTHEVFLFNSSGQVRNSYSDISFYKVITLPALILIAVVYILIACNILSVTISAKENELYILKSLGARVFDYFKVYSIINLFQLLLEMILGAVLGGILIVVLGNFIATLIGVTCVVLPLDILAIFMIIGIVVLVNLLALSYNILKIRRKNLRKSFQKVKM